MGRSVAKSQPRRIGRELCRHCVGCHWPPLHRSRRRIECQILVANEVSGETYTMTTAEWALEHGLPTDRLPLEVPDYHEPCLRTGREIAARCLVLQGVIATAAGCDTLSIVDWLREQDLWDSVT